MYSWQIPSQRKFVAWHSRSVAIISTKSPINLVYADIAVFNLNTNPDKHNPTLSVQRRTSKQNGCLYMTRCIGEVSRRWERDDRDPPQYHRTLLFHDRVRSYAHFLRQAVLRLHCQSDGQVGYFIIVHDLLFCIQSPRMHHPRQEWWTLHVEEWGPRSNALQQRKYGSHCKSCVP